MMNNQSDVKKNEITTSLNLYSNITELMTQTKTAIRLSFIAGLIVGSSIVLIGSVILK